MPRKRGQGKQRKDDQQRVAREIPVPVQPVQDVEER